MKEVDYADTIPLPQDAYPAPIKFSTLRYMLPPGTEIGLESGAGPSWLGGICSWSNYPVSRRVLNRKFNHIDLEAAFENALESIGYEVTNNVDVDYVREEDIGRAEFFISARLVDVDLDLCKRGGATSFNVFNSAPGAKGKIYARFEWSVFNALTRTVVYQTSTEGYSRRDYPNLEGLELLFMDAFDMAAHNLGADSYFYDLIVEGRKPPPEIYAPFGRHEESKHKRPRQFDPMEEVVLPAQMLRQQAFSTDASDKRKIAVTIQKYGHGSGFMISDQGHVLTNFHVVGESDRTRVIFADRKDAMTAEVLRVDRVRDVALLKLTEAPDPRYYDLLPLRLDKPKVGTDVYAIGTPMHYSRMENTVTKGIVSNHRTLKVSGVQLDYIQADVDVHQGNSGGPLLDAHGNIVGIAVLGYESAEGGRGIGLNLFVPLAEALDALDIQLD